MVGMSNEEWATKIEEAAAKRKLRGGFQCFVTFSGPVAGTW